MAYTVKKIDQVLCTILIGPLLTGLVFAWGLFEWACVASGSWTGAFVLLLPGVMLFAICTLMFRVVWR